MADTVVKRAEAFPLSDVRLLEGSRWRQNQQLDSTWICSFPVQRLLHSFRTTAGAWSALEGGYSGKQKVEKLGGWESLDCDLRGHAIGHLLSAFAMMYANTGDEIFKRKGDSLVSGIRECQEMMGTGYVSAFPEGLLKRNLQGTSVWAPWYTLHKVMAGLLQQYRLAGNCTALQVCRDFSSWASRFLSNENLALYIDEKAPTVEAVRQRALRNEFGGIGETFYDLYSITGDEADLHNAQFFYHNEKTDPLYAGNFDMGTQHCNTFLPKMAAEIKSYALGAGLNPHAAAAALTSLQMVDCFWHTMVHHHVLAPGCLSDKEHFFDPAETSRHLTGNTGETCCTYNLLKLTRELYAFNPDESAYFDYYERALVNHILGQQDPSTGMVHYFLPTLTGAYKLYSTSDKSFWCCVGSSFESHAKYAESVYWHSVSDDSLYVNLFIPTELNWQSRAIRIRQETDFPSHDVTRFTISTGGSRFTLLLRVPSWANSPSVMVNGRRVAVRRNKAGYIPLVRNWKEGDVVEYRLPMQLHTEAVVDDACRQAVFYGPVLLAGQLGTEGMNCWSDPTKHNDYYGYDYEVPEAIRMVQFDLKSIRPTAELEWTTSDGITIRPLFDTHRQRYVIYWTTK